MFRDGIAFGIGRTRIAAIAAIFAIGVLVSAHIAGARAHRQRETTTTVVTTAAMGDQAGRVNVAIYTSDQSGLAAWNTSRGTARRAAGVGAGSTRFLERESVRQSAIKELNAN